MSHDDPVLVVASGSRRRRVRLWEFLEPDRRETADAEANRWIKALRSVDVDGHHLRDRFTCRGDSLWWFTELYLHKERAVVEIWRTILALESLIARERPSEIELRAASPLVRYLTPQVARRHGVACSGRKFSTLGARIRHLRLWARGAYYLLATAGVRRPRTRAAPSEPMLGVVHNAFWHPDRLQDGYIGPVLRAMTAQEPSVPVHLVGVGPASTFRRRRAWRRWLRELGRSPTPHPGVTPVEAYGLGGRRAWCDAWRIRGAARRALTRSGSLRSRAVFRGYDAWPLIAEQLVGIAHLQLPWAITAMGRAAAMLEALRPRAIATYAEAGGWGRALILEARRRSIPTAGIQHGFISRHWLNYLHHPDEMAPSSANPSDRGFAYPTLTLVYDRLAADHLTTNGGLPESAVAVTGNPRMDELLEATRRLTPDDLRDARRRAGARDDQHLVVLASKYIEEFDRTFAALVRAAGELPGVHLAIKCHPADAPEPYQRLAAGAAHVTVVPASRPLAQLTAAARLLVTVNSTAAIEALALGVPALALRLPNYLSPFVEAGAMAGATRDIEIAPALRALVFDEQHRTRQSRASEEFLRRHAIVPDGHATERAAAAILGLARGARPARPAGDDGAPGEDERSCSRG